MTDASELSVEGVLYKDSKHNSGVVFAKSEQLEASLHANLPLEVLQVLRSASECHWSLSDNLASFTYSMH